MDPLNMLDDASAAIRPLCDLAQARLLLRVHTPLGDDVLFVKDVELWEGIGPLNGPSLGDAKPRGGSAMASATGAADAASSPFDASLGPIRAGLRLVVHVLATDAHLALKMLVGQPALVESLCQDDASQMRPWHGHIVAGAQIGSDGGLDRYRLVIEPWLAALAHRVDAWVYQDMSVPEILDDVFDGYASRGPPVPAWRWAWVDASAYPRRSLCIQYRESDLDLAQRLMREEGLVCGWEHTCDTTSASLETHTLGIADHNSAFAANARRVVRFTESDHTLGADSLVHWHDMRRTTSRLVAMRSRDHRTLGDRPVEAEVTTGCQASSRSIAAPTGLSGLSGLTGLTGLTGLSGLSGLSGPSGPSGPSKPSGLSGLSDLTIRRARRLCVLGPRAGPAPGHAPGRGARGGAHALARRPWRRAQAGTSFTLQDHLEHAVNMPRATPLSCSRCSTARATTSRPTGACALRGPGAGDRARPGRWRPGQGPAWAGRGRADARGGMAGAAAGGARAPGQRGPTTGCPAPGRRLRRLQPGRGSADRPAPLLVRSSRAGSLRQSEVCRTCARPWGTQTALVVGRTDADLHTDRDGRVRVQFHWQRGRRSSHRLTAERGDNAPASAASGAWVRVGQSLAGANHGAVFTPRIGQEVVVGFAGADIDRPVVAYDGRRWPDAPGSQMGSGAAHASGNAPAWFAGQQAAGDHEGHQHPAAMLGHKSQERGSSDAGTGGYNQLVFHDSVEGNRIELSTTTQATRLQIGALLHRQDNPRLAPQGAWAGADDPCPRLASSRLGHAAHRARTAARARVAAASSWKRAMPGPCCSGPRPCLRPGRVGAGAQRQARARADIRRGQARLDAPAVADRTRPAYPDRQPEGDGFDGDDGTRGG